VDDHKKQDEQTSTVLEDSRGALLLANTALPMTTPRTKHYVLYQFRSHIGDEMEVLAMSTQEHKADIFTEVLVSMWKKRGNNGLNATHNETCCIRILNNENNNINKNVWHHKVKWAQEKSIDNEQPRHKWVLATDDDGPYLMEAGAVTLKCLSVSWTTLCCHWAE